jgi:hypothetical protein
MEEERAVNETNRGGGVSRGWRAAGALSTPEAGRPAGCAPGHDLSGTQEQVAHLARVLGGRRRSTHCTSPSSTTRTPTPTADR